MADKQPMQASGEGTADDAGDPTRRKPGAGESQGGAYPNPHTGKDGKGFGGGQSERAYHGTGRLGDEKTGEQPNAGSSE